MEQQSTPVAQYVRMSSEHQRYSLDNQQLAMQPTRTCTVFALSKPILTVPRPASFSNGEKVSSSSCRTL